MIQALFVAVLVCLFIQTTPASAHVLITDSTSSRGAILHIIPDDNPIAGQESILYFDTQQGLIQSDQTTALLVITDRAGRTTTVAPSIDGSLLTAKYTFPIQGVYRLSYTIITKETKHTFEQSQRVSRGTQGSVLDTPSHVWAEMLLVASTTGIIVTIATGIRRRKAIAEQSVL